MAATLPPPPRLAWQPVEPTAAFPHAHIVEGCGSERFNCAICLQVMEEPALLAPCGECCSPTTYWGRRE